MISKQELLQARAEWQLDIGVIEKDYVLGWVLAAITAAPALSENWIFKGGTCLRKCFYETYRFSEDLDFTVIDGGTLESDELRTIFERVASWLAVESGIELLIDDRTFAASRNLRGNPTVQARIAYRGPNPRSSLPKLKLDLTSDELLVEQPILRSIIHPYGDSPLPTTGVLCYTLAELAAEKTRALAQRCRPRDLYDVVHIHATQTSSVEPRTFAQYSPRSASTSECPSLTPRGSAHRPTPARSSLSGRTCSGISSRDHSRRSRSSGTNSIRSSDG